MKFFETYNGGGFTVDLAGPVSRILTIANLMGEFGWIDKFSRAVFTDITIFNPNKNLFTRISIVVEFSETGRVQKKFESQAFQLYNYVGPGAVWNIISEVAVILFIFLFMKREMTKLKKVKNTVYILLRLCIKCMILRWDFYTSLHSGI